MLNGISPIILFNFFKLSPSAESEILKIPVVSDIVSKIGLPPIPIYLSETLTGLYINTETKNVDVDTNYETLTDGGIPKIKQKGVNSSVNIDLFANRGSIGLTLIGALIDLIFAKVTSEEYSITYLNGPVTVFGGVLKDFSVNQNSNSTLLDVNIQLQVQTFQATAKAPIPQPDRIFGPTPRLGQ